jgi:deoxyribonuclease V
MPLIDDGEIIGAALCIKAGTKPIYVSIGHKVDLEAAIFWVMECCRDLRIPEPTRLAHLAAGGQLIGKNIVKNKEDAHQAKLFP